MTPERSKIAFLTPSVRMFGARQSLLQLAKNLDSGRFEPIVVCPRAGDLEAALRDAGIATQVLPLPAWRKGINLFARNWRLRQLQHWARSTGIQLIHSNEFHTNPYAVRTGQSLGIPAVTHVRLSITERQQRNYLLANADRIICVSRAVAAELGGNAALTGKLRVIYNGLDCADFAARAQHGNFREEIGAAPGDFILGQIGLIEERKQQHIAVRAFGQLAGRYPRLRLAIVGSVSPGKEAYLRQVEEEIRKCGAPERVSLAPFRENIEPVFAGIDLNLLISNREGFGRVIIEAGCLGKPSIGARTGGIPEALAEGETGLLIDCGDAGQLAGAIGQLLDDPAQYKLLAENAARHAREKFGIAAHAAEMQNIYQELLAVT